MLDWPRDKRGRYRKPTSELLWSLWRDNIRQRGRAADRDLPELLAERNLIREQLIKLGDLHAPAESAPVTEPRRQAIAKGQRQRRAHEQAQA